MILKELFIRPMDDINVDELESFIMDAFQNVKYDNELIILKGHTLIEFAINFAIEKLAFAGAKELQKMNFHHKLLISKALGVFAGEEGESVFEQIRLVSKMRNEIAHKLSLDETRLPDLLKYYPTIKDKATSRVKRDLGINFVLIYLCTFILCRIKSKIDINNHGYEILNDEVIEKYVFAERLILRRHLNAMESTINA